MTGVLAVLAVASGGRGDGRGLRRLVVGERFGAAVRRVELEQTAPHFTGTVGNPDFLACRDWGLSPHRATKCSLDRVGALGIEPRPAD